MVSAGTPLCVSIQVLNWLDQEDLKSEITERKCKE